MSEFMGIHKNQFCVSSHDTFIVGRNANGQCKACKNASNKEWRRLNLNYSRDWQKNNIEKHRKANRKYAKTHMEIVTKWQKEHVEEEKIRKRNWNKANSEKVAQINLKHKINRKSRILNFDQEGIKEFYQNCPENMVVDHIVPLQGKKVSGLHVLKNLQYLTSKENSTKYNKFDGTLKNNGWKNNE